MLIKHCSRATNCLNNKVSRVLKSIERFDKWLDFRVGTSGSKRGFVQDIVGCFTAEFRIGRGLEKQNTSCQHATC